MQHERAKDTENFIPGLIYTCF